MSKHATRSNRRTEEGNAVIEFIGVMVVFIVPAITLLAVLATLASASFAAQAIAQDAARAFIRADSSDAAPADAMSAGERAWSDRSIPGTYAITFSCSQTPCLSPGASVEATATLDVTLPIIGTTRSVSATSKMRVDEFRRPR